MKVVLATSNPGKLKEFQLLSAAEAWLELSLAPSGFKPAETANTFIGNATIKAAEAAKLTGMMSVADDSGLVVEALDGKPGINSARYCEGSDADRRHKLLAELTKIEDGRRQASFVCAMAVCDPDGTRAFHAIRYWEGTIAREERGENGFGYDPIFRPLNKNVTAAELTAAEKNKISHRAQAWLQVVNFLKKHNSQL